MNSAHPDRPIANCYWVLPGKFLAGEYPGAKDAAAAREKVDALCAARVTAFIDLTEADEGLAHYGGLVGSASHQRFPIRDVSVPRSNEFVSGILDAIDGQMAAGGVVYVHCWGGVGRTGVVVGCWLSRHGHPGVAALARLQELWKSCPKSVRRESPETMEQRRFIENFREESKTSDLPMPPHGDRPPE